MDGQTPRLERRGPGRRRREGNWDPAVQGLAALPDVVKRLGDDIKWTTDLGNAFLAQQSDVMDAVQRMRKKASDAGNLKTTEQQKVTTQVVQTKEVIVIQQANPQVIYVPAYNPVVVYGPPIYPYPPIYYPPPGYYAAGVAIGFGVGVAMGAFWGGGWGYGPRWGYGSVNINVNNRYVNHYNRNNNSQPVRRQLESQSAASRRCAVRGSQHREPLWRHGAGRFRGDAGRIGGADTACSTGANRSGSAGANRAGASPGTSSAGANRGTAARAAVTASAIAASRATRFLQPKRQRLRRRLEQPPDQQRRPQQQPARVEQRGRVARALRRRRRATEVTGHDESTDDLDLCTIDGDAAHRRDGARPRPAWCASDVLADDAEPAPTQRRPPEAGPRGRAAARRHGIPDGAGGRRARSSRRRRRSTNRRSSRCSVQTARISSAPKTLSATSRTPSRLPRWRRKGTRSS